MYKLENLYRLIHALDASEKRYFKLYASMWGTEKKSNYLRLFEIIEEQKVYNEEKLQQLIDKEPYATYLRSVSKYLFETILKSLRNYHDEHNETMQLLNRMKDISILRQKGMIREAVKQYQKTKVQLEKRELYTLLIELLNTGEVLWAAHLNNKELKDKLEEIHRNKLSYEENLRRIIEYRMLARELKNALGQIHPIRNETQESIVHKYLEHPLLQSPETAPTPITKVIFYECLIVCYMALLDHQKFYESAKACFSTIEPFKGNSPVHQHIYINSWYNLLLSISLVKETTHFEETLSQFSAFINSPVKPLQSNAKIQALKFYYYAISHHLFHIKDYQKLASLETELSNFFEKNQNHLDAEFKMTNSFNLAASFFHIQEYEKAIDWNNYVLEDERNPAKLSCFCHARILEIMIHYECGNYELLNSLFRSTYRFLQKQERLFKSERILLNFFRRVGKNYDGKKLDKEFRKLKLQLEELQTNKYEMNFLKALDLFNWLQKYTV